MQQPQEGGGRPASLAAEAAGISAAAAVDVAAVEFSAVVPLDPDVYFGLA